VPSPDRAVEADGRERGAVRSRPEGEGSYAVRRLHDRLVERLPRLPLPPGGRFERLAGLRIPPADRAVPAGRGEQAPAIGERADHDGPDISVVPGPDRWQLLAAEGVAPA